MDECNWSKTRYDEIINKLSPFLEKTCGYDLEKDVHFVPVSGYYGMNINKPLKEGVCEWYKGPTMFGVMDNIPKANRIERDCLRIPVFDAHREKGNLYVYGKIESGVVREGMKCTLMPHRKEFTCLKMFDNEDNEIAVAESGDNVRISVKGIEIEDIKPGFMICGAQFHCRVAKEFLCEITAVDPPENKVITGGFPAVLHLHTIQTEVIITKVKSNTTTGKNKGLINIKAEETGIVKIQSEVPLCLEKFEEFPEI